MLYRVFSRDPLTLKRKEGSYHPPSLFEVLSNQEATDINSNCDGLRSFSMTGALTNLLKLIPFTLFLPILFLCMGWQIALGRILGDKTDEGLDARTSYHMLFGMFGSMLWWPILATIITVLAIVFNSNIDSTVPGIGSAMLSSDK